MDDRQEFFDRALARSVQFYSDVQELQNEISSLPVPRRVVLDRSNPLELYEDSSFRKNFGFSKTNFCHLLDLIIEPLQTESSRRTALPPVLKLTTFLDYMKTNNFQR